MNSYQRWARAIHLVQCFEEEGRVSPMNAEHAARVLVRYHYHMNEIEGPETVLADAPRAVHKLLQREGVAGDVCEIVRMWQAWGRHRLALRAERGYQWGRMNRARES